ncbi:MAG: right-handed parallel beta-helix repeat-containing protein [Mucilaginibacter sp.]
MEKLFYSTPVKFTWLMGLLSVFFVTQCVAQQPDNFTYKPVPSSFLPSASTLAPYHRKADAIAQNAYDLTNALPSGYVTDGSVDYTSYLQQGIKSHPNVVFPDFPVMISPHGLMLASNSIVIFKPKSKLIIQPSALPNYSGLTLYNVNNVAVYFPVIVGDRKSHTGTTGEWGQGINISGSSNIQIINPNVSECWGDGIYIGKTKQMGSKNISIYYAVLDHDRRNGISVINADTLEIIQPVISNINGTSPMAGIDIEPNDNEDIVDHIVIDKAKTFNTRQGISIELIGLAGAKRKTVNIDINGHVDSKSYTAFAVGLFPKVHNVNDIDGNIRINGSSWKDNSKPFYYAGEFHDFGPTVELKNVKVTNKNIERTDVLDKARNDMANRERLLIH